MITAPTMVFVDGFDIGTLGFIVSTVDGWRDVPRSRQRNVQLVGRQGNIAVEPGLALAPRNITVRGAIQQDTFQELKDAIQELSGRLFNISTVRFIDNTDRESNVRIIGYSTVPFAAQFDAREYAFNFTLLGLDPFIFETALTSDTFTSTKTALALGNAISKPLITINGPVTDPVITYRNAASVILETTGLTVVIASGDKVEIDSADHSIIHTISATPSNTPELLTSGTFIDLDPNDADDQFAPSPIFPSLECLPTASCDVDYKKAFVA